MPQRLTCTHLCSYNEDCDGNEPEEEELTQRAHWIGKLDFVLSCIGYGVGIGDLIRFPYLFVKNGGGAFLVPFLVFLALCGFPLFYLEVSLGQFSSQSCTTAWKISPLFKGIGWAMLIVSAILSTYYVMMIVWTMNYLFLSFQSTVPWSTCNNTWNTVNCVRDYTTKVSYNVSYNATNSAGNVSQFGVNNTLTKTAAEEFWERKILGLSSGIDDLGSIQWQLCLCLLATWMLVVVCLSRGIRTSGRIVYVTVIVPYFLLTVFLVRGATLPGAGAGVIHFLTPQWHRLLSVQVWIEGAVQVFFSLGPAWGGLITMASYNRFRHKSFRDAVITTIADGATGLYGGLVISCVLGFMAHEAGVHVSTVVAHGPGLALVAYPEAISKLPVPQFWAFLFFITLVFLGLDSQFGMVESVCSGLCDEFPHIFHRSKGLLTVCLAIVAFLLGLPFTTQGGMYLYQIIDWYATSFAVTVIGFLECIVIGWIYGAGYFSFDIELMNQKRPSLFIRICWTVITPALLLLCLISMFMHYAPPKYGDYTYPQWAITIGILLSFLSLLPIPIMAGVQLHKARGSIWQRFMTSLKPNTLWGPLAPRYRNMYDKLLIERSHHTCIQRLFGWGVPAALVDASSTAVENPADHINHIFEGIDEEWMIRHQLMNRNEMSQPRHRADERRMKGDRKETKKADDKAIIKALDPRGSGYIGASILLQIRENTDETDATLDDSCDVFKSLNLESDAVPVNVGEVKLDDEMLMTDVEEDLNDKEEMDKGKVKVDDEMLTTEVDVELNEKKEMCTGKVKLDDDTFCDSVFLSLPIQESELINDDLGRLESLLIDESLGMDESDENKLIDKNDVKLAENTRNTRIIRGNDAVYEENKEGIEESGGNVDGNMVDKNIADENIDENIHENSLDDSQQALLNNESK